MLDQVQIKRMQVTSSTQGMSPNLSQRVNSLTKALNQPFIDLKKIRAFMADGIPDEAAMVREYAWKLVLGYLPTIRSKWQEQQRRQQEVYQSFIRQYLPPEKFKQWPLPSGRGNEGWDQHEKDYLLWQQIEKDTSRTQAELSFFSREQEGLQIPYLTPSRREKHRIIHGDKAQLKEKSSQRRVYRYDYMTRILFIYAKLNPRAEYVQGMNQVLAPIFYLVNCRKTEVEEAACFFMFNNVMTDLIELNIQAFDKNDNGIHAKIKQINRILLASQPKLWQHMETIGIDPFFYCFRWMTLLFAQQFELFEILRVWESIFSHEDRSGFANFLVVAILSACKKEIMVKDYSETMLLLKHVREHFYLPNVLFRASELFHELRGVDVTSMANRNLEGLRNGNQTGMGRKTKSLANFIRNFL